MTTTDKKRLGIFLVFAFVISWIGGLVIFLTGGLENSPSYNIAGVEISLALVILSTVYMLAPALANLLTRLFTKDRTSLFLRPVFCRKRWVYFLIAWVLPGILTILGMVLFFLLFPHFFDSGLTTLQEQLDALGSIETIPWLIIIGQTVLAIFISPLLNALPTFGEEFGWRGYLLPKLMPLGGRKASLVSGVIWGIWHWPAILMGHNYGLNYFGAPFLGPLAMVWFTIVIGVLFSWVTIKSESVWPAVIGHGALNGIAALSILFIKGSPNPLLGPAPTGIIGGAGFFLIALIIFLHPKSLEPKIKVPSSPPGDHINELNT